MHSCPAYCTNTDVHLASQKAGREGGILTKHKITWFSANFVAKKDHQQMRYLPTLTREKKHKKRKKDDLRHL